MVDRLMVWGRTAAQAAYLATAATCVLALIALLLLSGMLAMMWVASLAFESMSARIVATVLLTVWLVFFAMKMAVPR